MLKHEIATICNDGCFECKTDAHGAPVTISFAPTPMKIKILFYGVRSKIKQILTEAAERQVPCKNWRDENSDQVKDIKTELFAHLW